jgi:hypothetical protein
MFDLRSGGVFVQEGKKRQSSGRRTLKSEQEAIATRVILKINFDVVVEKVGK